MCTATPDVRKIAERERAVNRYVVVTFFGNVERVWVNLRIFWICPRIFRKFAKFLETCSEILGTTKKYLDMSANFQKCREISENMLGTSGKMLKDVFGYGLFVLKIS